MKELVSRVEPPLSWERLGGVRRLDGCGIIGLPSGTAKPDAGLREITWRAVASQAQAQELAASLKDVFEQAEYDLDVQLDPGRLVSATNATGEGDVYYWWLKKEGEEVRLVGRTTCLYAE